MARPSVWEAVSEGGAAPCEGEAGASGGSSVLVLVET